ncbi:MAG: esterase [Proteobacteria bacterium]|uniref:Esterase n=1 Tax=SAR86 cluster bacterium TaxID=2030880 RepID=A0A937LJ39_9GAMM|nr:esterase [SAR86 cluster bacterium]MBL6820207.1 esterase [SAR86 cluster bacterium]MDA0344442.1 esterase [Pseudomonadota bacterium]MDA0899718.1 esterase [Pseudomonadota bacterium]
MKNKDLIIYVHGWNSFKNARKASLLKKLINNEHFEVISLTLESHPKNAIAQLSKLIEQEMMHRKVHLIGSSLGGYYSTYLSEKYNLKAVMINPAVWAYKIFENNRGENENPNTGEKYYIDQEWIDSLEEIFIDSLKLKSNFLVLLQTADETLDYRYAEKYFEGTSIVIDEGGSHSFDNLESKIASISIHFGENQ